jgi:phenylalanyl-tRNA synthetase alpha chain
MELSENQVAVLSAFGSAGGIMTVGKIVEATGLDQSPAVAACAELEPLGLLTIEQSTYDEITLGDEGLPFVDAPLPERTIVSVLRAQGGKCKLIDVPSHCGLSQSQVGQSLRWLNQRGWATKKDDTLELLEGAPAENDAPTADEQLIAALGGGRVARSTELAAEGIDLDAALSLLTKRKGFLRVKPRTERKVEITDAGLEFRQKVAVKQRVTQLRPELLADGSWRNVEFQPYDVTLAAKKLYPGKEHPFQRTIDKVRRVFLEMGFTEIVSPWVESSFWDFDALFQPQDHPARDMQDTFYIRKPAKCRLPDDALVDRIKATHEDGGDTGSTGWRYRWNRELAHKPVLRTHTTAATIRALAKHAEQSHSASENSRDTSDQSRDTSDQSRDRKEADQRREHAGTQESRKDVAPFGLAAFLPAGVSHDVPGKYFVTGPVHRREAVDFKHLPVFQQVDGIIVDPKASLSTLLGTLSAFYRKMGFPKVRFRPSFFPYTEPSVEVDLWFEHRGEWVEMGGSGIFRPEVTRPLGIRDRVLAWGLGLERIAMMQHGLKSIGELYFATMPWLRETAVNDA